MFAAVTCFLTKEEELTLSTSLSEKDIKATFIFVFDNCNGNILASHTEGSFSKEQFEEAIDISKNQTTTIFKFYSQVLLTQKLR